jgi:hypothetical protein
MTDSDSLLSTAPVVNPTGNARPILVVGLPRSGSSFLSEVLSQIGSHYVFDDLYLIPKGQRYGLNRALSDKALDKLLFFLGWQIRARLKFGSFAIPNVEMDEVDPMNDALKQTFQGRDCTVLDLQEEWLTRLAHRNGCAEWGFKLPKAFLYVNRLIKRYPDLKIVFLMRRPDQVLASYKQMPKQLRDGDPDQYHPIAKALYWRLAAKQFFKIAAQHPDNVTFIRFQDLVKDPTTVAHQIAAFVGVPAPEKIEFEGKKNSSHQGGETRGPLTSSEHWFIDATCGSLATKLGFETTPGRLRVGDIGDLMVSTTRFIKYWLKRVYHSVTR